MRNIKKVNNDVYIGAVLVVFALFFLFQTQTIKKTAAIFPRISLAVILVFSIIIFYQGIRKTIHPELQMKSDLLLSFKVIQSPMMVMLIVVVYVVLMNFIGFFLSSVLFVPAIMLYYGTKSIKTILITDAALNLFIYGLFVMLLNVYIP